MMITMEQFKNMDGTGGTDVDGDWQWSGSWYQQLHKGRNGLNHHYQVHFTRDGWIGKTKGWRLSIYLCLTYCNSDEICILREKTKTLKAAKELAVKRINEFDNSNEPNERIEEYLKEHALPVFTEKNGELIFLGTTYRSESSDMERVSGGRIEDWLYYNDDIPDYNNYNQFYSIHKSYWSKDGLYVSRTTKQFSGYSGGSLDDGDELRNRIIELTKSMPKFQHLFLEKEKNEAV